MLVVIERADRSRYFEASLPILRDAGFNVGLVTVLPAGEIHEVLSANGFSVAALGCEGSGSYPRGIAKLARIIRAQQPDLISAHEPIPAVIAGAARKLSRRDPPLLLHRHHSVVFGAQRVLSRAASALSDRTVGVSINSLEAAKSSDRVNADRQFLAWNGIPDLREVASSEVRDVRDELNLAANDVLALTVARFRPEKGLLHLLNAFERTEGDDVHLAIVGDGPDFAELNRAVVSSAMADRVHLAGARDDVAPWYRAADLVVVPSLSEPFGLVAIEAAAASRPVVASNVGGLREIVVESETGLLVPPGDAVSLGRAMTHLAASPQERRELGAAARSRYEELFTVEAMVSRWVDGYEVALADRR